MKAHGNHMIYNRQVYGILYGEVRRRLKWGYLDYVRAHVGGELQAAFDKTARR